MISLLAVVLLGAGPDVWVEPVTRYVWISYQVPADAPEEVRVKCEWTAAGKEEWHPAKVTPLIGETGMNLASEDDWRSWQGGLVTERRAAGLVRIVVFNPYPEAQRDGKVDCDFRISVETVDGKTLTETRTRVRADNGDVFCIEDWSKILQQELLKSGGWKVDADGLTGESEPEAGLPPVSYMLDLRGKYAIFVCTKAGYGMRLRLTGDERSDTVSSRRPSEEVLWRYCDMSRQGLVLNQPHGYKGYSTARIDYVRLVPVRDEDMPPEFPADKLTAGYWEPYSWAFYGDIRETRQHIEPLLAFQEARIGLVDTQIGRFGMKVVYETRRTDPLLYATIGDPVEGDARPLTSNVGKMQQYTNTLATELRYAKQLGLNMHANFGASNCYIGSPLQGDISKEHPDWVRSHCLRFEVPEVREYAMKLYRESLEIGAPGISIDFCRYPETVDSAETGNTFMRELHNLAEEFSRSRNAHVPVLARFPATGVRRGQFFDYTTWAKEGWVDYLCPSNIQGRHLHFDIAPYMAAVNGTHCTLLPCMEGLGWGPAMPGPFLWRARQLYAAGVKGLYVYQADARVLGTPAERRYMRALSSSGELAAWWENETRMQPRRSKSIYIPRAEAPNGLWHSYERLRPWVEGVELGAMELYLDGQLVNKCDGPPYMLGTEDYASDGVIPAGKHQLRVRVKDGDGWLEQEFQIEGG
jgi:hypothetical protein